MIYIATSKNGIKVSYDDADSHAATHIQDTPQLIELLQEIIPTMKLIEDYIEHEHNFGNAVGYTDLVENRPEDVIVYAKRKNRDSYNPFNKSQNAQPCNYVSLALQRIDDKNYELLSAYVGKEGTPAFPGDERATDESIPFWNKHSFVFGNQEIQEDSLTDTCPW